MSAMTRRQFTVRLRPEKYACYEQMMYETREQLRRDALRMVSVVLANSLTSAATPPLHGDSRKTSESGGAVPPPACRAEYSCEAVCRGVQTLVEIGDGEALYTELQAMFQAHSALIVQQLVATLAECPEQLIEKLGDAWRRYLAAAREVEVVWMYLDRRFIRLMTQDRSICGAATVALRCAMYGDSPDEVTPPPLLQAAFARFSMALQAERGGGTISADAMLSCTNFFTQTNMYFDHLEPLVLAGTEEYYTAAVERHLQQVGDNPGLFFRKCDSWLSEEVARAERYLWPPSVARVERVTQRALLLAHGGRVLESGMDGLFHAGLYEEIHLAWRLLSKRYVDQGKRVQATLRTFVTKATQDIASAAQVSGRDEYQVVEKLIGLMKRCEVVIQSSLDNLDVFHAIKREAFGQGLHTNPGPLAELLARFIDSYLRDGARRVNETVDAREAVMNALAIFALLPSKDLFEVFYGRDLARRLAQYRSVSVSLEALAVRRMKELCGPSYTSKFEGMINDIESVSQVNLLYEMWRKTHVADEEVVGAAAAGGPVVTYCILREGLWPTMAPLALRLPEKLMAPLRAYESYFASTSSGRRLTWAHALSTCTLEGRFTMGRRDITASLLQALILLTVDAAPPSPEGRGGGSMTVAAVSAQLGIAPDSPETVTAVLALVSEQVPLLLRASSQGDGRCRHSDVEMVADGSGSTATLATAAGGLGPLAASDRLTVNVDFTSRAMRVRAPQISLRPPGLAAALRGTEPLSLASPSDSGSVPLGWAGESSTAAAVAAAAEASVAEEQRQTTMRVTAERDYALEAAVVRFMKSRRTASHDDLFQAVATMVRFPVTMPSLKRSIESLIERGFLERESATGYSYVS